MRILIIVHHPTRKGGAYFRGQGFAKPLARRGHEVWMMTIAPEARLRLVEKPVENFRVVESPDLLSGVGRTGWDPWDTLRRCLWMHGQRFDIIHTVDTRPAVSIPALYGRRVTGAKWVADWTDWWGRGGATSERPGWAIRTFIGPLEQWFEERPKRWADGVIHISRALGERAAGLGVDPQRMLYLPPGADPDAIREQSRAEARQKLGLDQERPYIGYLGNIYQRDADLLFDAVQRMKHQRARLIMIGGGAFRITGGIGERLIQTGHVPFAQMLDYLSACDVLALPLSDTIANRGRWPSKINEYVAVGRPTVACAVGDLCDLFEQHEIGLLSPPEPDAFAARIDRLLDEPELAQRMGDTARAMARSSYSQDRVAERLEGFYNKVLHNFERQGTGK